MLHSQHDTSVRDSKIESISRWCDLTFKCAIYAVTSFWIDDKAEERVTSITMTMDRTTGKATVEQEDRVVKPMHVPKKYRRSTEDI